VDIILYRFYPLNWAPKDTTARALIRGQVFTFCEELIDQSANGVGRDQMGGIPGVQTTNARRLTDAANPPLIERRLHPSFTQQLPLGIGQKAWPILTVTGMIIAHGLLQWGWGIHPILQSRDPTGGLEPIYPQAQLSPHQPIERGKRLVIDDRRDTYDQRFTGLIGYRDCAESPGLSTEQCGNAGTLIGSERHVMVVRLHDQMVTPGPIDPGIEWE
jgi:hypothetical protein